MNLKKLKKGMRIKKAVLAFIFLVLLLTVNNFVYPNDSRIIVGGGVEIINQGR